MAFIGGLFKMKDCYKCSKLIPGKRLKKRVLRPMPCPPGFSVKKPNCSSSPITPPPGIPLKTCVRCSGNTKITKKCVATCSRANCGLGGNLFKPYNWRPNVSNGLVWSCKLNIYVRPRKKLPGGERLASDSVVRAPYNPSTPVAPVTPNRPPANPVSPVRGTDNLPDRPVVNTIQEDVLDIVYVVEVPELEVPIVEPTKYPETYIQPGLTAEEIRAIIREETKEDEEEAKKAGMSSNSMIMMGLVGLVVVLALRKI